MSIKFEDIERLLIGIDKTEYVSSAGWWETSTGAKYGARILAKIKELFDNDNKTECREKHWQQLAGEFACMVNWACVELLNGNTTANDLAQAEDYLERVKDYLEFNDDLEDENIIEYPCEHGHFSGECEEECH